MNSAPSDRYLSSSCFTIESKLFCFKSEAEKCMDINSWLLATHCTPFHQVVLRELRAYDKKRKKERYERVFRALLQFLAAINSTVFSQLNAPGVYFKIGLVYPAFILKPALNRGPAFIYEVQFSDFFSD